MVVPPDLEYKVDWLTANENIRRVISVYAKAGDDFNDPEVMASLLAEDAVWEAKGFGRHEGRETIARELAKVGQERIVWSLHFPVAPIIDISDDLQSAHAFWWLWELLTMRDDNGVDDNKWLGATYDCDFVRQADGWKIKALVLDIKKMVPFEDAPLNL